MTSTEVLVILHSGVASQFSASGAAPSVPLDVISAARRPEKTHFRSRAPSFGAQAHGYPQGMNESRTSVGAMVPGLVTIATSFVALVVGAVAMVAGYLTFGAVALIVSLAAATFGAVWLLSGMLLSEHHPHLHGRHV